jgi:hypothetical protein
VEYLVIYEMSARRYFLRMSALFEARATKGRVLHLRENVPNTSSQSLVKVSIELIAIAIYFHSFKILIIQNGDLAFCTTEFIIINSNYFQNIQKNECFLDDFETLARERRFRAQVLQNRPQPHTGARISISRTTMRSRNVILKVVNPKRIFEER